MSQSMSSMASGMSSMSMDMASMSMSMDSMSMASMSMSMESDSMSMSMSMDNMASMSSMSMETGSMDDMDMDSTMYMHFYKQYKDVPVLFSELKAHNGGQAFGIFLLLFFIGILSKGIEFSRIYLETRVWHNPDYYLSDSSGHLVASNLTEKSGDEGDVTQVKASGLSTTSSIIRNIIRFWLHFFPELFGFSLMLAAMSYSVLYFFAVVLGLSFGRLIFDRLSHRFHLPLNNELHHG